MMRYVPQVFTNLYTCVFPYIVHACLLFLQIPLHKFYADEILIWLEMEHPDIVELYGVIVYDGYVCIIQELITGSE